jgi:hypothetical protein
MSIEDILAEVGEEKAAIINAHIESIRQAEMRKGIEASKKKGAENTKLIGELARYKDALREAAGIEDFGEDPAETIREKIAALKGNQQPGKTGDSDAIKALKKQLDEVTAKMTEKEQMAEQANAKYRNSKIAAHLSKEMSGKFRGVDLAIRDWIRENKVKINDNDEIVFIGSDESDVYEPKKFLETYAKENPDLVISQQIPGGGSAGNRVDYKKVKQISTDNYEKLQT